ncbi:MAG: nitroreductase family protein [Armatimonadetes bacterium]|jgi:nitroreductase/NAD-dependent dihydropyrimidine dehydrogenase PreA subunit|nr:nitroreductase family protein [Armatimonadota bacterium]MDI9582988.1 nitroreductase family protein [Acidobacteriota bacterium]
MSSDITPETPGQTISDELCTRCGLCVTICPAWVFRRTNGVVEVDPQNSALCVQCGHCMAICPTGAVTVNGLDPGQFGELGGKPAEVEALETLFRRRRSVRKFRNQPVPRELLQRVIDAAAMAPMGFPPSQVEITVLPTRDIVEKLVAPTMAQCEQLKKMLSNPIGRFIFHRMAPAKAVVAVEQELLPLLDPWLKLYHEEGIDCVTWGAPAMLLFHVAKSAAAGETDCVIASTYAMLEAEAMGLGSIMLGMANSTVERDADLRAEFAIPADNQIFSVLALGYPAHSFRRSIPRNFRSVHWVDEATEEDA